MRLSSFLPFAAGAVALVGCTTNVGAANGTGSEGVSEASAGVSARGIVVVEGSTANEGSRSEAVARFVRARAGAAGAGAGAIDDDALRMVGATVDFPASGTCESLAALRGPSATRAIALLDVGGVTLMAGDAVATLQARQVPDVADLVSGVVYSTRADDLPSKSAYVLRILGSADLDVPAFVVSATSPGEPTNVRVAGDDGVRSAVVIAASARSNLELTWDAGTGEDAIYVDVSATNGAPATRCLFDDVGRASIPMSALGAIDDGALSVHRLHRESFRARGVEPGEVRFDFARVVPFTRR